MSAVAGTLTFSGWEKKQKPRDTGGGAGEKEGMEENVVTWKPTEEKTWKTREQPTVSCHVKTCTDPRLPKCHEGDGGSLRQRMQEGTGVELEPWKQVFHSKSWFFVLFLNKGEQRNGWDLEGDVWSRGC